MPRHDDYIWRGMFLHYIFVYILLVVFLWFRGYNVFNNMTDAVMLFIVVAAGDLLVHEFIKMTKFGRR